MPKQPKSATTALKHWADTIREQRRQHSRLMNQERWKDRAMCPCGCGLTLGRAMRRHPARVRAALHETQKLIGRPISKAKRCPCGLMTAKTAALRYHKCDPARIRELSECPF